MMKPIRKKYKNIGMAVALTFNAAILIGSMFSCNKIEKLEEKDEIVAVLDFSEAGGGSSGGSPEVSQSKESDAAPDKPVEKPQEAEPETATQEAESATNSSESESTQTSEHDGEGESQKPANDFGGLFGHGGGDGGGDDGGAGGSGGEVGGGDGPGIGSGIGDGSGRYTLSKPSVKNPIQEVGDVYIKLIIRRDGSVKSATIMKKHKNTTAVSPVQFALAKKKALQYVFNSDQTGKHDLVGLYITVKFTLN